MLKNIKKFFSSHDDSPEKGTKTLLREKYEVFTRLLSENNNVLELMADMEEKATGKYLFDRAYLLNTVNAISSGVLDIVEKLNILSKDRYPALKDAHGSISASIDSAISPRTDFPGGTYTITLSGMTDDMVLSAGGKMAHLGEISNSLSIPTPQGFLISSTSFIRFMEFNHIKEKIHPILEGLTLKNLDELEKAAEAIRKIVMDAEIPPDLAQAVLNETEALWNLIGKPMPLAVRSSAINEDGEFTFAGQYATFLNVMPDEVLPKYKEVIASLFTSRAIFYYKTKGYSEDEMIMAVGILQMVDAQCGGVLYTRDPNDPDQDVLVINASWGLPKSVVDGTTETDTFIVSRSTGKVIHSKIAEKGIEAVADENTGTRDMEISGARRTLPSLTDEHIGILANYALKIEGHYGRPQDMEWAVSKEGKVIVLQSRPLKVIDKTVRKAIPRRLDSHPIIIDKGVIACSGIGYGKAYIVRGDQDISGFPEGGVLIARHTSTRFVTVMDRASAIITDVGGITGHMASLAREYGVPAILDTGNATKLINNEEEITVDAVNCNVYRGKVEELLALAPAKREPIKDTHLFRIFEAVMKHTVSLHLIDPEAENFTPEACTSYHDITRFCHEKAMDEMFGMSDTDEVSEDETIILKAGIPLDAHVLDVGGGIREGVKKATAEDVLSIPFSYFLKGLKAMRWPEPRPADAKGFIGMMAHTASVPEEQLRETAQKSFSILSEHYMNFSIRLGYHFSMVEAFAGKNRNDNYIKFFFKGGGAARDRRLRRVRLISDILRKLDFEVKTVEDVIDASLPKYPQGEIERRLEVIGRLTVFTKQLDMAMFNDMITDSFMEQFLRDHAKEE